MIIWLVARPPSGHFDSIKKNSEEELRVKITVYYNLAFTFIAPAISSISYDNIGLAKVIDEISKHSGMDKNRSNKARNASIRRSVRFKTSQQLGPKTENECIHNVAKNPSLHKKKLLKQTTQNSKFCRSKLNQKACLEAVVDVYRKQLGL